MIAVILVPLLPLLATLIVLVGDEASRQQRAKIAAYPVGAAFLGAIVTLWYVATRGAITIRFYDPASLAMLVLPIGFYIDRLSAVMMVLISGVGTIIYTYSIDYMYQEPHDRRYLAMLGVAVFVLLCMVSSANLLMLFLFWQVLSYLLYILIHNHAPCRDPGSCVSHFYHLTGRRRRLSCRDRRGLPTLRHAGVSRSVCRSRTIHFDGLGVARHRAERRDGGHLAAVRRRHEQVCAVSPPHLDAALSLCPDTGALRCCTRGSSMPVDS